MSGSLRRVSAPNRPRARALTPLLLCVGVSKVVALRGLGDGGPISYTAASRPSLPLVSAPLNHQQQTHSCSKTAHKHKHPTRPC